MSAVLIVGRDIGGTVYRLCSVEANEAIEQAPAPIEGLGRVPGRPTLSMRRRREARRRAVIRITGHETVVPAGAAVRRSVIAGPDIAVDGSGAVVVRAGGNDVRVVRIDGDRRLVLRPFVDAAVRHGRIRSTVIPGVASRLEVPRHSAVRRRGRGHRRYQADQAGDHGYTRPQKTCAHLRNPPMALYSW